MSEAILKRIAQIYQPPNTMSGWSLDDILGERPVIYFSLARQALHTALQSIGVCKGDVVLLPELICADIIPAIINLGVEPLYYPVDKALKPVLDYQGMTPAKAIIAVNYFGFPQNLTPFHEYCRKYDAVLIEDNAHGLFSRDARGALLGARGDIGLFSLRKTLPLLNGAALVVNNAKLDIAPVPQLPFDNTPVSWRWRIKQLMRGLSSACGPVCMQAIIGIGRFARDRLLPVQGMEPSYASDPLGQFTVAAPYAAFNRDISKTDVPQEIERRRELYIWLEEYLHGCPCSPVFGRLEEYVVPYGYPFFAEEKDMPEIHKRLKKKGLSCFSWPNLPAEVEADAPEWYKKIRVVQFLW